MKLFKDLPSTDAPINAENLNQIQDNLVVVSATEPTGDNREKVWMQKGKNLFDMNLIPNTDVMTNDEKGTLTIANNVSNVGYVDTGMKLSAVFKGIVGQTYISSFENTFSMAGRNDRFYLSGVNAYIIKNTPFILTQDMLDSTIILYGGYNETSTIKNMQIEQNSTATAYEQYIEPKIYVKNDNNVYEEFIKEKDSGWQFITETGESYAYMHYRKIGKMVELISPLYSEKGISISGWGTTLLGTLPVGFRPHKKLYAPIICKNSNNDVINSCYVLIDIDGTIKLSNMTGSNYTTICVIYFSTMFFTE